MKTDWPTKKIRRNMKKKSKIQKGDILKTALEIAPFTAQLLGPEIVSNPLTVVVKVGQVIATHFLRKFSSEYNAKIDNHELKSREFATEKPALIFADLLRIIDEGKIDEERFKAMKSIFFSSIAKDATEDGEVLAYQLMQTCKKLSSAEILILTGTYAVVKNTGRQLARGSEWGSNSSVGYWAQVVSEKIGHNLPELVLQHEANLIDLKLITGHRYKTNKVATDDLYQPSPYFRLTPLGYKLCEFMTKYE